MLYIYITLYVCKTVVITVLITVVMLRSRLYDKARSAIVIHQIISSVSLLCFGPL